MNLRENTAFFLWWSKWSRTILAFTWFLGLLFGLGLFLSSGESFYWLIHQAVGAKTSFAMLCGTLLLPFLFFCDCGISVKTVISFDRLLF